MSIISEEILLKRMTEDAKGRRMRANTAQIARLTDVVETLCRRVNDLEVQVERLVREEAERRRGLLRGQLREKVQRLAE